MPIINLEVPSEYSGSERLDKYIAQSDSFMNRSRLKTCAKKILVNDKEVKVSYKVKACDKIFIEWEENVPSDIKAENIPLDIIYEDEDVCVINKKQGMVTHPALGNWNGTLVNALLWHRGEELTSKENLRPGIVHRLDKDTSGLIITAKNRYAEEWLSHQFKNHRSIKKEYICICLGRPSHQHGTIRTQIIRDPRNRKLFKAVTGTDEGKKAVTKYSCIACYGEYSLFRVQILTGRTHQIRVHMKYLNCPILGDSLYSKQDKKFSKATLMLHARRLEIILPDKSEKSIFTTSTPERFLEVQKVLKRDYKKTILDRGK